MGNCGSSPKTNEGPDEPLPEPVAVNKNKEVKIEQQENNNNAGEKNVVDTEEIPVSTTSDENSLRTMLTEKKEEKVKAEEEAEVVKKEVVAKEQEAKTEDFKMVEEAEKNKLNSTEQES